MQTFAEKEYYRPDLEALRADYRDILAMLRKADSADACMQAILAMEKCEAALYEMQTVAHIRNTVDTRDPFYEGEVAFYNEELPRLIPLRKRYLRMLLHTPFRSELEERCGAQLFRVAQAQLRTQSPRIIRLLSREAALRTQYNKTVAACKTTFQGESCNFYGLLKYMQQPERETRRAAFAAWAQLYASIAPTLDALYDQLLAVRRKMAKQLGFADATELAYLKRSRLDYTPQDVAAFREQILNVVVPACMKLRQAQAKKLGVDKLRFYDEPLLYPQGNPTPQGECDTLIAHAQQMYREMSPESGEFFDFMVQHQLFDLQTRPGKRVGGYCTMLPQSKAPFIFSNFNGTSADVDVLTHEAGHAFQAYLSSREQLLQENCHSTSEINEIHSMAMEHFAYPWMPLFFGQDAARYQQAHLLEALEVLPYMACVDAFQHEVYADENMDAAGRRATWKKLEQRYLPWRDYEEEPFLSAGGFWMQKQHIFLYPFYYIDYALAQIGAFELYGRMQQDRDTAWADYLRLCRAGGSRSYRELLALANLSDPFAAGSVEKAVRSVLAELESYCD